MISQLIEIIYGICSLPLWGQFVFDMREFVRVVVPRYQHTYQEGSSYFIEQQTKHTVKPRNMEALTVYIKGKAPAGAAPAKRLKGVRDDAAV